MEWGERGTNQGDEVVEQMRLSDSHSRQALVLDVNHMNMEVVYRQRATSASLQDLQ